VCPSNFFFLYFAYFSYFENKQEKTQTHRQQGDLISVLLFFPNKESKLKIAGGL
jgi:hypothetical protein